MAQTNSPEVDDYIAAQPEVVQKLLVRVRAAIRKAAPSADEVISYRIPALRLPAGIILYFAGWKKHYSVYPVTEPLLAAFAEELEPYDLDKGTIRFSLDEPVPSALITRIAKFRVQQLGEAVAARLEKKKKKQSTTSTSTTAKKKTASASPTAMKKSAGTSARRPSKKTATAKKQSRKL